MQFISQVNKLWRCTTIGNHVSTGDEDFEHRRVDVDWILKVEEENKSWMTPIKDYLLKKSLTKNQNERQKLMCKVSRFIMQGVLYKKRFSTSLLRHVDKDEAI